MKKLALVCFCLIFASCVPDGPSGGRTPSSNTTMTEAEVFAQQWVKDRPDHAVFHISPLTRSMAPALDNNCLVLAERFTGKMPNKNDICIYDYSDEFPAVCHRAVSLNAADREVMFEGDNNPIGQRGQSSSDGWISIDRINWRVAGVIYTQH